MTRHLHPDFADAVFDEVSFWSSRFGALLIDNLELRPNVRGLDVGGICRERESGR